MRDLTGEYLYDEEKKEEQDKCHHFFKVKDRQRRKVCEQCGLIKFDNNV